MEGKKGWRMCMILLLPAVWFMCVSLGSVFVPVGQVLRMMWLRVTGAGGAWTSMDTILFSVRMPRVLNAALIGACLSLAGGAMQGLLQNPLAEGSTMGVSSGAALGALTALVLSWSAPWMPLGGQMGTAMLFALLSMVMILWLARQMDAGMSNTTMVLLGVVFSMLASALISLITAFSGEKLRSVTFWLMGSLSSGTYGSAAWTAGALLLGSILLFRQWHALDALSMGAYQAQHLGTDVRRVKVQVIAGVSVLIGVSVAVGGSIAFVGLIVPHFVRLLTGPGHRKLLPYSAWAGSVFLMLADLLSRTLISPRELPVGVITSLVGALTFGIIFYRKGRVIP